MSWQHQLQSNFNTLGMDPIPRFHKTGQTLTLLSYPRHMVEVPHLLTGDPLEFKTLWVSVS